MFQYGGSRTNWGSTIKMAMWKAWKWWLWVYSWKVHGICTTLDTKRKRLRMFSCSRPLDLFYERERGSHERIYVYVGKMNIEQRDFFKFWTWFFMKYMSQILVICFYNTLKNCGIEIELFALIQGCWLRALCILYAKFLDLALLRPLM